MQDPQKETNQNRTDTESDSSISFPLMAHLFYPCDVVHCQFLQRALQLFVVSCCRFVNNLFLPAGRSLKGKKWIS